MGSLGQPTLNELSQSALNLMTSGRADEAVRIWERVLSLDPRHPKANLYLAQNVLLKGDARRALGLLSVAREVSPKDPVVFLNLSFVHRALGNETAELEALEGALAADPYCFPALLSKGAMYDRRGKRRQAAQVYKDALTIAPAEDQLPPSLKGPIARARQVVADNMSELETFLQDKLQERIAGLDYEALRRFDRCVATAVGRQKIYHSQPTLLTFPGLPAVEYFDRSLFPWLSQLEAKTSSIRAELLALMDRKKSDFLPYVQYGAGVPLNQWAGLNFSVDWTAYFLWKTDVKDEDHCRQCPVTAAALNNIPRADIPTFAPTAFFSALRPRTTIPPHTGVTNARLTVHLPVMVPPGGCWFRVGGETREWKEGEAWVFDDTIEHEACNPTDELRVILIFDIWNPYVTDIERELIRELLPAIYDYYQIDYGSL